VHDLVQIGSGQRTLTKKQLNMAVILPKLKVLPRPQRVALRDEKECLAQNREAGETT